MSIEIANIKKSFGRTQVLNDISLDIPSGQMVALLGPSGSGKTTLLNIIGLLDRPDRGEVLYRGQNVLGYNQEESALYRNRNIGFVFQDHLLLPYLTVLENILLPLLASFTSDHDYRQKADEARRMIEKTGITGIESKYPYQISGGEAQRATLVRALVNQPSLLLADEPTGSLDRRNAENLGNLLADVNREYGTTLILATHSQELADRMKVQYSLSEGRLTDGKH